MAQTTRATEVLRRAGVPFELRPYSYDPDAQSYGMQAAEALNEPPIRVLKTLMAAVDEKVVCAILPADREVSMKKLASAAAGKSAHMLAPALAERQTGYHVGGISPFGQKRRAASFLEILALEQPYIIVNGGQRGLLIQVAPADLVRILDAQAAPLVA